MLVTKILSLCVHSEPLCSAGKKPASHTILFLNTWLFRFNKVTGFHHNSAIFPLGWVPLDLKVKIYVTLAFLLTLCGFFCLHHATNLWELAMNNTRMSPPLMVLGAGEEKQKQSHKQLYNVNMTYLKKCCSHQDTCDPI